MKSGALNPASKISDSTLAIATMFITPWRAVTLVERELTLLKENPAAHCLGLLIDLAANINADYSTAETNALRYMNQSGYDLSRCSVIVKRMQFLLNL